jgi:hypothetical protein
MDAAFWTIKDYASGLTKTFEEWGVSSSQPITRNLMSQAIDTFGFTIGNLTVDAAMPFAMHRLVTVYRNGVPWFSGIVTRCDRTAAADRESLEYVISGPWWFLENLPFQSYWNIATTPTDPASPLTATPKSRSILFQDIAGSRITTAQQIQEAVLYAQSKGAFLTLATPALPVVRPPFSEVVDQACSEIVRAALRWHPDAVAFFDYSQIPPALRIRSRFSCTPVSLPFAGSPATGVRITPRNDLVTAGCKIIYEIVSSIDETSWTQHVVDQVGADGLQTVVVTVQLSGSNETFQRQKVTVTAGDPSTNAFWRARLRWLADVSDLDLTIEEPKVDGVPHSPGSFINELTEGAVPFWLDSTTSTVEITALATYKLTNPETGAEEKKTRSPVICRGFKQTSLFAGTQTFARLTSFTPAEPIPSGVAAAYQTAAGSLHYEGTWSIAEDEVSGQVLVGNLLNLTGGPAEWETMNALVQTITEDIVNGRTQIRFGPGEHLSVQDFIQLMRVQRGRAPSWRLQERVDGKSYGTHGQVEGATKTPNSESQAPSVPGDRAVLATKPDTNPSKVIIDVADIVAAVQALSDKDIKLRELDYCDGSTAKKILVLCSAPY